MTTTNRFPPLKYLVAGAIAACVLTWFAIRLAREKAQTTPSEAASTAGEFDLSLPVNVDAMDRLDEGDPRRRPLAFDPELQNLVRRIFISTVLRWLEKRADQRGVVPAKGGAAILVQRFGSALD